MTSKWIQEYAFMTFLRFVFPGEKMTVLQSFNETGADNSGILHIYSFWILEDPDIHLQGIHPVLQPVTGTFYNSDCYKSLQNTNHINTVY